MGQVVKSARLASLILAALGVAVAASAQTVSGQAAATQWARSALVPLRSVEPSSSVNDLQPLGKMIGDAPLVAVSEAVHLGAEPLQFRNRLFQYLVREKKFTAIAIESGIVEGRGVHDYVRGGPGELSAVAAQGISWTMDRAPQNRELIRWIRGYNANRRNARKINFYGFDVPGSPGNAAARRGPDTALVEAMKYLAAVDPAASARLHARLDALLANLRFGDQRTAETPGYHRFTQAQRDALTAAITDLITLLERSESRYVRASSTDNYAWAYRAALGARQVDNWLRQLPSGWDQVRDSKDLPMAYRRFFSPATDVRDRAQADNVDWIRSREGAAGKILIFAARYHLSASPVRTVWSGSEPQQVAGTYLRRRFASEFVTIGNLMGKGISGCGEEHETHQPGLLDSMDRMASELGIPLFVLDLRAAPAPVAAWLDQERVLGWQAADILKMRIGKAFDILFYIDTVAPAC